MDLLSRDPGSRLALAAVFGVALAVWLLANSAGPEPARRLEGPSTNRDDAVRTTEVMAEEGGSNAAERQGEAAGPNEAGVDGSQKPWPLGLDGSVLAALEWIVQNQDADGGWSGDASAPDRTGADHAPPGGADDRLRFTALALLCLSSSGETSIGGRYRTAVRRGLRFLSRAQKPSGRFGTAVGDRSSMRIHACATAAVIDEYALTGSRGMRVTAQSSVEYMHGSQRPYRAWRAGWKGSATDLETACWVALANETAKFAGLEADCATSLRHAARRGVSRVTRSSSHDADSASQGGVEASRELLLGALSSQRGLALRVLLPTAPGEPDQDQTYLEACAERLLANEAERASSGEDTDLVGWYFGTIASFRVGGRHWREWRGTVLPRVQQGQRESGSWNPTERGEPRLAATALRCLTLQVPYRWGRWGMRYRTK